MCGKFAINGSGRTDAAVRPPEVQPPLDAPACLPDMHVFMGNLPSERGEDPPLHACMHVCTEFELAR